jgi:hypothetical protein
MAAAGSIGPNFNPNTFGQASGVTQFGAPSNYSAAATTQAGDYDTIMKNYGNLVSNATSNPITATPIAPQTNTAAQVTAPSAVTSQGVTAQNVTAQQAPYQQSSDVTGSLADLSNLTQTGGYTAQGKADILARDVSPTRSIYANAQQNMNQQRALSGGYSPNFNAASLANTNAENNAISATDTAANAGIAQNVAANQIAAGGAYAGAAGSANAATEAANLANANIVNQVNETNVGNQLQAGEFSSGQNLAAQQTNAANAMQANQQNQNAINQINQANQSVNLQGQTTNASNQLQAQQANTQNVQAATGGMANLYGTTPALTNTFGNQVMQAGQLGQGQQNLNLQSQRQVLGAAGGY